MLMATGLGLADFTFHGVGIVTPLDTNCIREIKNMNLVVDSKTVNDPLLRAPYFEDKRAGRTVAKHANYIDHVKQCYPGNDALIDQVEKCDSNGGWRSLRWPW